MRFFLQIARKFVTSRNASCINETISKRSLKTASSGPKHVTGDWIGPPDPDSNIRTYKLHQPSHEKPAERKLREFREDTLKFNQEFWSKHNKNFSKSKEMFISERLIAHKKQDPGKSLTKLSPEELSEFYRGFLDGNYSLHKKYLREWYKRNFTQVWLSAKVQLDKVIGR